MSIISQVLRAIHASFYLIIDNFFPQFYGFTNGKLESLNNPPLSYNLKERDWGFKHRYVFLGTITESQCTNCTHYLFSLINWEDSGCRWKAHLETIRKRVSEQHKGNLENAKIRSLKSVLEITHDLPEMLLVSISYSSDFEEVYL